MKKFFCLILVLLIFSVNNLTIADDGADVFINTGSVGTIDFSGRTFGGDDGPIDIVELLGGRVLDNDPVVLGGRIRKVKKTKEKIYITIEIKTNNQKPKIKHSVINPVIPICISLGCYGPVPTPTPPPIISIDENEPINISDTNLGSGSY